MLELLKFKNVGPGPELGIEFRPRMNILVGDNGLGKTFLLDVAWWALTRTWSGEKAIPFRPPAKPSIKYQYRATKKQYSPKPVIFDRETEEWKIPRGRPPIPGLVIYARVDGGFSVWDPSRNYWKGENKDRQSAYIFEPRDVWDGLPSDNSVKFCNGLIADWASWQLENGEAFAQLKAVLLSLSPSPDELVIPGKLRKVSLNDARRHPTIKMPYGQEVPLIHASSGMRRIIALAYLLVWTWQEHVSSAELRGDAPAREIIFLVDEIEAHLHPQWQRRLVPALLGVMEVLTGQLDVPVQLIAATHSPLVMASIEPHFDEERDGLFHLSLAKEKVELKEQKWAQQGDVVGWLVSEAFGLRQGRSLEAEQAIEAAEAWMRGDPSSLPGDLRTKDKIHDELVRVLAGHDPFWPRWIIRIEKGDKRS